MLTSKKSASKSAFTFTEVLISSAILAIVFSMLFNWLYMQRQYQRRLTSLSFAQQEIRRANWEIIQELQIARSLIWPRTEIEDAIISDSKILFKNFEGDIVCYYFVEEGGEIRRCLIPNGPGAVTADSKPVATGLDRVAFTTYQFDVKIASIYMASSGAFGIESVSLLNE